MLKIIKDDGIVKINSGIVTELRFKQPKQKISIITMQSANVSLKINAEEGLILNAEGCITLNETIRGIELYKNYTIYSLFVIANTDVDLQIIT